MQREKVLGLNVFNMGNINVKNVFHYAAVLMAICGQTESSNRKAVMYHKLFIIKHCKWNYNYIVMEDHK